MALKAELACLMSTLQRRKTFKTGRSFQKTLCQILETGMQVTSFGLQVSNSWYVEMVCSSGFAMIDSFQPNNSYAMFYSARMNPSSTDECIGVAVGDSPKGPFHPNKKSVACPPG